MTVTANPGSSAFTSARIGSNPGFGEYFDGAIDNVFIFNEILSNERIDEIRRVGANAILPPVVAPEPTSLMLVATALIGIAATRRRR